VAIVFQWSGKPPGLITDLRYWVVIRSLSPAIDRGSTSTTAIDRMHQYCLARVRHYLFAEKWKWNAIDRQNYLAWEIMLALPPTHRIDIGYVSKQVNYQIFWTVLNLSAMPAPSSFSARAIGRFFISQILKYQSNYLLIKSQDNDEFYLLMLTAIGKRLLNLKHRGSGRDRAS
jgi:hypothetical protein